VLSYDAESNSVVPRKVVNWFNNGPTEHFFHFRVARPTGSGGPTGFAVTPNHLVRTPGGWREAGELIVGDRVLHTAKHYLSQMQWQLVLGGLMGDGTLSANKSGLAARYRWGHGKKQDAYSQWKAEMFGNLQVAGYRNSRGGLTYDVTPLAELAELRKVMYLTGRRKTITEEYLKALTPMALAVWYMDDGGFTVRSKGLQQRTEGGSGRVEICVQGMTEGSQDRLRDYLRDVHDLDVRLRVAGQRKQTYLQFSTSASARFHEIIAPYVHPSMEYKLLPRFRGQFGIQPEFTEPTEALVPCPILSIAPKALTSTQPRNRYDIEVEGSHNYFADGVMVHNSPETTTGGRALKFYSSVRLDVRRIETLKDGQEMVGNRTRIKVVKNKVAPPFKQAEFDIMYGQGISREGGLIDVGVEAGLVRKAGAWYTYEGDQLGQGKENARAFLRDNPDLANELEKKILEKLGVGPQVDAEPEAPFTEPTGIDF
jgi:recombination protein RecA